jgi:uncharacterized RDD family membrane protein YckC
MTDLPPPVHRPTPAPPPPPIWTTGSGRQLAGVPIGGGGVAQYARFWRRVGADLLDLLLYGLLFAAFAMTAFLSAMEGNDTCHSFGSEAGAVIEVVCAPDAPDTGPRVATLVVGVVGMLFVAGIYLRALGRSGQTWGRRIARVRVVRNHTGEPIGFGRALGRQLFAFATRSLVLGHLWMLWDAERQTWHDKVADTIVVAS